MGLASLAGRPLSQYRIRADRRVQLPLTSTSRSESAHVSVSNRRRPCMCVEVDARRNRRSGQRSLGTMEVKMQTLLSICVLPAVSHRTHAHIRLSESEPVSFFCTTTPTAWTACHDVIVRTYSPPRCPAPSVVAHDWPDPFNTCCRQTIAASYQSDQYVTCVLHRRRPSSERPAFFIQNIARYHASVASYHWPIPSIIRRRGGKSDARRFGIS